MADQSPEYRHGQAGLSSHEVHWRYQALLDVPPAFLVTEADPMDFRMAMARFVDGRNVNDVLYRAVLSIRTGYELEPHPYMVVLPELAAEIPIDILPITDETGHVAGIVSKPRSLHDVPFEITLASPGLTVEGREPAIQAVKDLTRGHECLTLPDRFADGNRYRHVFESGLYRHSYRSVVAFVPEVHRT